LFISYAKGDGEALAQRLIDNLSSHTDIAFFLSGFDIPAGITFDDLTTHALNQSALLVILTDTYASRAWCQRDILEAKQRSRPMVVINAITSGETRSFPYLGNVPTIRWAPHVEYSLDDESTVETIIGMVMIESLRQEYFRQSFEDFRTLYSLEEDVTILPYPPELVTYLTIRKSMKSPLILVYPEPPMGTLEAQLFQELDPDLTLVTPAMLAALIGATS
jgi:hypothetical protein